MNRDDIEPVEQIEQMVEDGVDNLIAKINKKYKGRYEVSVEGFRFKVSSLECLTNPESSAESFVESNENPDSIAEYVEDQIDELVAKIQKQHEGRYTIEVGLRYGDVIRAHVAPVEKKK